MICDGSQFALWMNDRNGRFEDSGSRSTKTGTAAMEIAKVDADADHDLLIAAAAGVDMFHGSLVGTQGSATFVASAALGLESSNAVAMGDVDGDGDEDKVVANTGGNRVFINDGQGNFSFSNTAAHTLGGSDSRAVVLGDLDGDGDLDAITSVTGSAANRVYLNR